jgi:hypothetical protein
MDRVREVIANCPKCLTFETLWFRRRVMMPTRRFKQNGGGKVYHDCGSNLPCRLFPRFKGEQYDRRPSN